MDSYYISGIQQIGCGNQSVYNTWEWYRKHLGMDIPVFNDAGPAKLMTKYTGGEVCDRHAILAMNFAGGGGFEFWQFTSRTPQGPSFNIQFGDLGIMCPKIKTQSIQDSFDYFKKNQLNTVSEIHTKPFGIPHFFAKDPWGNWIEISESNDMYSPPIGHSGGIVGVTIGVKDIASQLVLFRDILGYDTILSETYDYNEDVKSFNDESNQFHRVLLTHSKKRIGPFSELLGPSIIELVSNTSRSGKRIFENRYWGDLGYIHLCFDIINMDELQQKCNALNYPFTVDTSGAFDMGEAAGRFAYIETEDGILIEFVETFKIPILKKIGWYLNLKNFNRAKALPKFLLKTLTWSRKTKDVTK